MLLCNHKTVKKVEYMIIVGGSTCESRHQQIGIHFVDPGIGHMGTAAVNNNVMVRRSSNPRWLPKYRGSRGPLKPSAEGTMENAYWVLGEVTRLCIW